jgi:hypothetical protein
MKSFWIDDEKHRQIRLRAADKGCSLIQIFNEMFYQYFNINPKTEKPENLFKVKENE